jgi:CopG family nickel-responsive transcriptional regulator
MSVVSKQCVSRISVSLPETMLQEIDQMVERRGFESRSQALVNMIHQQITQYHGEYGNEIMAGTINLVYDHTTPGLQKQLVDLQHENIDEVISSLHVHLMQAKTMEVILVQGPAKKLKLIADKLQSCRGVIAGNLQMSTALIPQLHPPGLPMRVVPAQED